MKRFKSSLFFLVLLLAFTQSVEAKEVAKGGWAKLVLKVADQSLVGRLKLRLEMSVDDLNMNFTTDKKVINFIVQDTVSEYRIPLSVPLNYGRISLLVGNKRLFFVHNNNLFLFRDRDSVVLSLQGQRVSISGRGGAKFRCLSELYAIEPAVGVGENKNSLARKDYGEMVRAQMKPIDSIYQIQRKVLAGYRALLGDEEAELIATDLWAEYNYLRLGRLVRILSRNNTKGNVYYEALRNQYDNIRSTLNNSEFSEQALIKSFHYVGFMMLWAEFHVNLSNAAVDGSYPKYSNSTEIFTFITSSFKGGLRDKLLLRFFYHALNKKAEAPELATKALDVMEVNIFKRKLELANARRQTQVVDSALVDEKGRMVRLSDFRGKVVVIEFWFTGCSACKLVAEQMKSIVASYHGRKDISFLTVSIDKTKEAWLKSVKSGEYTDSGQVNLYTGGLVEEHPLIKEYNIMSYPAIFVISKSGSMISTAPPKPKKSSPEQTKAFIKLIEKSLGD